MAKKDSWFKHYNTAHEGLSMSQLWAGKEYAAIAFYWALLEMVSRHEDENSRGKLEVNLATFKMKLGLNAQTSLKLLLRIAQTFKIEVKQKSDKTYEVFIPNWSELQERRGGKTKPKLDQISTETGTDLRLKTKDERQETKDTDFEHDKSRLDECLAEWKTTLEYFKITRSILPGEDIALLRGIKQFGAESVILALKGARREPSGKNYDPANYCSLPRYLNPQKFSRFVSLGSGADPEKMDLSDIFGGQAS